MNIPGTAKDRPIFKGLLVPYTVEWFNGVPDFKVSSPAAIKRCVLDRRCGLCGKKLQKLMWFIGGPLSIANRMFTDPAMHKQCAEYSMNVCPFLSGQITEMAASYKNAVDRLDTNVEPKRPDRFGLLETIGCQFVKFDGNVYIRAEPGIARWWPQNPATVQSDP